MSDKKSASEAVDGEDHGASNWAVFRQDFTGNEFLVERNLTLAAAKRVMAELEAHPHHQHYWVDQVCENPNPFTTMLAELIAAGSPLAASIEVLRNQNASERQLISAIQTVRRCTEEEARDFLSGKEC